MTQSQVLNRLLSTMLLAALLWWEILYFRHGDALLALIYPLVALFIVAGIMDLVVAVCFAWNRSSDAVHMRRKQR